MRDDRSHIVRSGYFHCAKSDLMLERGLNVNILRSHLSSHVMGEFRVGVSEKIIPLNSDYNEFHIDNICIFIAAIQ